MGLSNEWTEWHLTELGWVRGSCKTDFGLETKLPPSDRVLTNTYKEKMSSSFSNIDANIHENWNCRDTYKIQGHSPKRFIAPPSLFTSQRSR